MANGRQVSRKEAVAFLGPCRMILAGVNDAFQICKPQSHVVLPNGLLLQAYGRKSCVNL